MKAERVIEVAKRYLGYCEKASNSQLENFTANAGSANYTVFALRLYDAGYYNGNKNGYAWCDCFVDYCFYEAADYDAEEAQRVECQTGDLGAGCLYSAGYYKAQGRFDKEPRPGDQVFFIVGGEIGHTGLVIAVYDTSILTIEGNSGDKVQQHRHERGAASIAGYGHPKYEDLHAEEEKSVTKSNYDGLPEVRRGDKSAAVKILQYMLLYAGEKLPRWGADGECGDETLAAIRSFQKRAKLFPDGVCGKKTWGALLEGWK